ncbi:MAG: sensor histidine kinase [Candidatus Binatia bacterium]
MIKPDLESTREKKREQQPRWRQLLLAGLFLCSTLGVILIAYTQIALEVKKKFSLEDVFLEGILFVLVFVWALIILPHWRDFRILSLGVLLLLFGNFSDLLDEFIRLPRWIRGYLEGGLLASGGALSAIGLLWWIKESQRFLQSLKGSSENQRLLRELSQDITSLDINSLLRKLPEKVREVFKVDVSDIRILEGENWRVMEISGLDPNLIPSTRSRAIRSGAIYGRLRWIVENRKPLMIPDSAEEETFPPGETVKSLGLRGYLGVPLLSKSGEVTGILRALTYQPREFTQEEVDLLQQLANGAAVALENARLFEEVQKKSKELEEAFKAKSEFLNTMAHELRTPLNVVIGHTELLEVGFYGDLDQKIIQRLETIGKNARTILNLTDEVLELARIEAKRVPLQIKEFPLKEMMDELEISLIPLVEEKGLDLRFELDGVIPTLKNDQLKIQEVLQNLLTNAIKYTDKGAVELRISALPDRQSSDPECGQILFSVRDTGIGIKGEDIPRLFEPFFIADGVDRVKYPGSGLGLSIVKRLVTLLGGEIKVESEWGKGSTFTVILPVVQRSEP